MSTYTKYNWSKENMPEGWEEVLNEYERAIDDRIFNAYNPEFTPPVLVTAPREKIICECEATKWSYSEPLYFDENCQNPVKTMMAMMISTKIPVRYRASNGIQIVSSDSGTHWFDTERRLQICFMNTGMMACGNIGIIVNEGVFNMITYAINEYNGRWERAERTLPDFISFNEYNEITSEQKEAVRRLYYQDECVVRWVKEGCPVPKPEKKIVNKQLSDDLFKVE